MKWPWQKDKPKSKKRRGSTVTVGQISDNYNSVIIIDGRGYRKKDKKPKTGGGR